MSEMQLISLHFDNITEILQKIAILTELVIVQTNVIPKELSNELNWTEVRNKRQKCYEYLYTL